MIPGYVVTRALKPLVDRYVKHKERLLFDFQPYRTSTADYTNSNRLVFGTVIIILFMVGLGFAVHLFTEDLILAGAVWIFGIKVVLWSVEINDKFRRNRRILKLWLNQNSLHHFKDHRQKLIVRIRSLLNKYSR